MSWVEQLQCIELLLVFYQSKIPLDWPWSWSWFVPWHYLLDKRAVSGFVGPKDDAPEQSIFFPTARCLPGRLLSAHIAQWWCCCVNNLVMLCQVIVFSCFLSQMNFVGICPLRLPCSILFTFHNLRFNSISQPKITNSSNLKSPGCSTWSASTWRWVQLITDDNGGDYDNDRWR